MSTGSGSNLAIMCVLTTNTLFRQITSFMTGWPRFVLDFARQVRSNPKYETFADEVGFLPFCAIQEGDAKVLKAFYKLSRMPQYQSLPNLQFGHVMHCAIVSESMEMIRVVHHVMTSGDNQWKWEPHLIYRPLWTSKLEILDWLVEHAPSEKLKLGKLGIERLLVRGSLEVVKWLFEHEYEFPANAIAISIESKRPDVASFLRENYHNHVCSAQTMNEVAERNHFEIVD